MTELQQPNRTVESGSSYSGHIARENSPIHWHSFSQEAFDKAKRENKPVFLTIGFP